METGAQQTTQTEKHLRLLMETGLFLASERSLDVIVQAALDAGLRLCDARFGAFYYCPLGEAGGKPYSLYKIAGPDNIFTALAAPPHTLDIPSLGRTILRIADLTLDSPFHGDPPFAGLLPEDLPIRSFLAIPMHSRTGDILGYLFYGHPEANVFTSSGEDLVAIIASQAAVAIDNIRLSESLTSEIATREAQANALLQSEKLAATGRLAATIAHEINNPLEAVTNLIYLSRTDPDVPQPIQVLLQTADTELARVAQIAQQTLGFYRDTTRPIEIDLNELLHSVVNLFARKMVSQKITCTLDLDPDLCIHGLQGEIRQIFSNLMVNAIDAFNSEPGIPNGAIHLRGRHLRAPHSGVSVLVCDQGSGIPASVRQRIFSPFFTTKQSVGTGLGLWVTRGFAEKHGGSIHFRTRTTAPSGTIFRIILPVNAPSTLLQASDPAPQFIS
jgi:signal transduction histidine kinase